MKLDLQLFGGRGASSSRAGRGNNVREINGRPVVNETNGIYQYWNIGKNAPSGYVGLLRKGMTGAENTAYIKSKYADEIANFRSAGSNAMTYSTIQTLDREITRKEKQLEKLNSEGTIKNSNRIARLNYDLKQMKRAREIRKALNL